MGTSTNIPFLYKSDCKSSFLCHGKYFGHEISCCSSLTLNLLTTTIVAPPSNSSKWQMGFNSAFRGLNTVDVNTLRCCATSRTVPGSIPRGVTGDFFPWFLPTKPCALRSTQPLEMSTRDFSWGKGGQWVWMTTYHPCSAESQEDPRP
jgi:hypothetical protein